MDIECIEERHQAARLFWELYGDDLLQANRDLAVKTLRSDVWRGMMVGKYDESEMWIEALQGQGAFVSDLRFFTFLRAGHLVYLATLMKNLLRILGRNGKRRLSRFFGRFAGTVGQ
jgi:hypothetical protein